MQHNAVTVALQGSVEVASQDFAVQEPDRHLAGGRVGQLLVALELDPFDRRQGDPGRLVVLQPAGVVDLDEEVRLVKIKIASRSFDRLVVEEADDYPGHVIPTVLTIISRHSCAGL